MSALMLAQAVGPIATWGLIQWIVALIIICGIIAIMYIILGVLGYTIPPWVIRIFWICVAVVVAIFAIKFLASLL